MSEQESEKPNQLGKLRRYANVSSAVGGLAMKLAGERYLGIEIDRENHAKTLASVLGGLKGPLMKVAQILSTIPDALPPEYRKELSKLQADAPSMGWLFVQRRMKNELGNNWFNNFYSFEKIANKAASLGQVHKAILKENKELVACKLQYPDMESAIKADLKQLKLILKVYKQIESLLIKALQDRVKVEGVERLFKKYNVEINNTFFAI